MSKIKFSENGKICKTRSFRFSLKKSANIKFRLWWIVSESKEFSQIKQKKKCRLSVSMRVLSVENSSRNFDFPKADS